MNTFSRKMLSLALIGGLLLSSVPGVSAAGILLLNAMHLHDFDAAILSSLGYDNTASVTYFKELASISTGELQERNSYEGIGCFPFYVMRNAQVDEKGYNCRSFFCVGYKKGPQICHDIDGKPYGGIVEIQNRLSEVHPPDQRKYFADFSSELQTPQMTALTDQLAQIRCRPFYTLEYNVAVGQGYDCDEVGKYPNYSAKNVCKTDWRTGSGQLICDVPLRQDEVAIRLKALGISAAASSSDSSVSSIASAASVSSAFSNSSSSSNSPVSSPASPFPDVIVNHYGYTAITSLAYDGTVHGYADGTFHPEQTVNRAEFLALLMRGLYPDEIIGEHDCFPDVKNTWYSGEVCAAKRLGWITGYKEGTFRPSQSISKAEGLKIIMATLGPVPNSSTSLPAGVASDQWFSPYIQWAIDTHVLLETAFDPFAAATRADAAVWMYRAKKAASTPAA